MLLWSSPSLSRVSLSSSLRAPPPLAPMLSVIVKTSARMSIWSVSRWPTLPPVVAAPSLLTAALPRPPWWTPRVVLMVLLFFTRPLSFLPNAVLAAIVFRIGVKLVDFRGLTEIRRSQPQEFALALVTALTVVLFGVEPGI